MMRRQQRGYSLIELMIATSLAVITGMVTLQVAANFQARRVITSGNNEAVVSVAVGLSSIERELRMAGAGLIGSSGLQCKNGVNIAYKNVTVRNGEPLQLVAIVDGGTGPDTVQYIRSDASQKSNTGGPLYIIDTMGSPDAALHVERDDGLITGDLYLAGSADGNKLCTLYQMSDPPLVYDTVVKLLHSPGNAYGYNPDTTAVFTDPMSYDTSDQVINLGPQPILAFSIACKNGPVVQGNFSPGGGGGSSAGTADKAASNCDLVRYAPIEESPAIGTGRSVASQIIDLQAQYGIAPTGSQSITEWVDATGATWIKPSNDDFKRVKAIRIALVARGEYDAALVSPEKLVLWKDPPTGQVLTESKLEKTLSTEERHYRYQVLSTVVPLVNVIRGGL